MHNLVSHFILEKYIGKQNGGESGGLLHAVCLFADLSGFSIATHSLLLHGQEAVESMAEVMLGIFTPLVSLVHAQGGFITTFAGDAFTALFPSEGDPASYFRALAAARAIQEHMRTHPKQDTLYGSFPFAIKLGLGDGEVEWGILESEQPAANPGAQNAAYYFSGPAIEAAAGAEHQAQDGELILTQPVYAQLHTAIQGKALGVGHWCCLDVRDQLPAPQPSRPDEALAAVEAAFIPPAISQRDSSGDFRQVVSVFIQLMGIETRQDLDIFMQAVFSLLNQYEGYLNRVDFGDKGCNLLLYWGMPISHENDISRALDFVMELGNHTPGSFRAGLTYRLMYAGLSGSTERGEYTCYGDGINLAARLMMEAPWGGIWVDEQVASRAQGHYEYESVGLLTFKGFPEAQIVHNLLERRLTGQNYFDGQMVGRQAELTELNAFVQPLFAPAGERRYAGILTVVGEAGLGKSRLVQEFISNESWPIAGAAQVFVCQTDQILRQSLNPFRRWLQNYFDQSPSQSVERNKRAFSRKLDQLIAAQKNSELGQELNRTRSFLGALVGLEWESSLYARLDLQGRYENTLQSLQALLKAESLHQPVVLVLEDAHWLDEDSQEFVRRLEHAIEPYPIALLATARPERLDSLYGSQYPYRSLVLTNLSAEDLAALVRDRLGGPVAPQVLDLLVKRAESNPFFAEQILLYLREQNKLTFQNGVWSLVNSSHAALLPAEVRNIFIARLDCLSREIQNIVHAAAILGREFEVRVLAHVMEIDHHGEGLPDELALQITTAEQESIWTALSQLRYLFRHALLRDAAYEMQLKARRRELHRLAAVSLEHLSASDIRRGAVQMAEYVDQIAYHYETAYCLGLEAVRPQAYQYLKQAARQAAERYENSASLDWYDRALALCPSEDRQACWDLTLGREAVLDRMARREAQFADLETLECLAKDLAAPDHQAQAAIRKANYYLATSDLQNAVTAAQMAITFAQAAGQPLSQAEAHWHKGFALNRLGDFVGSRQHVEAALTLVRQSDDPLARRLMAIALRLMAFLYENDPETMPQADSTLKESLHICREIGDKRNELRALNNLGVLALIKYFDLAQAATYFKQAMDISQEIGDASARYYQFGNMEVVYEWQEDFAQAQAYGLQALHAAQEAGDRFGEGDALSCLGNLARKTGDYGKSMALIQVGLDILQQVGEKSFLAGAQINLGWLYLELGNYDQATLHMEEVRTLANSMPNLAFDSAYMQGWLYLYQQDASGAQASFEQAMSNLGQDAPPNREADCWAGLGYAHMAARRPDMAAKAFENALVLRRRLNLPSQAFQAQIGLARALLDQGELTEAQAHTGDVMTFLEAEGDLTKGQGWGLAYLECVEILRVFDPAHSQQILQSARKILLARLATIPDEAQRKSFLEHIPWNRALMDA